MSELTPHDGETNLVDGLRCVGSVRPLDAEVVTSMAAHGV